MNQETKKWIDMAEMDYGVARHLYETYYPKPYEIIKWGKTIIESL